MLQKKKKQKTISCLLHLKLKGSISHNNLTRNMVSSQIRGGDPQRWRPLTKFQSQSSGQPSYTLVLLYSSMNVHSCFGPIQSQLSLARQRKLSFVIAKWEPYFNYCCKALQLKCLRGLWLYKIPRSYACVATRGVLCKKVSLEISQNSQKNTCARVSFLIKLQAFLLKKGLWHRCFFVNSVKFLGAPFLQNTSGRLLLNS